MVISSSPFFYYASSFYIFSLYVFLFYTMRTCIFKIKWTLSNWINSSKRNLIFFRLKFIREGHSSCSYMECLPGSKYWPPVLSMYGWDKPVGADYYSCLPHYIFFLVGEINSHSHCLLLLWSLSLWCSVMAWQRMPTSPHKSHLNCNLSYLPSMTARFPFLQKFISNSHYILCGAMELFLF